MAAAEKTVRIGNARGLHARAAAKFVKLAEGASATVTVARDGVEVCGTSIMGLLMLAASRGTEVRISVSGDNAATVLQQLVALVEDDFGEAQ